MNSRVTILVLGLLVAATHVVEAAPKRAHKKAHAAKTLAAKNKKKSTSGELKTDVSFDDSVLHGEYQTPDEALAKVENEKGLSDLLGVRKHFKDRLHKAAEQE